MPYFNPWRPQNLGLTDRGTNPRRPVAPRSARPSAPMAPPRPTLGPRPAPAPPDFLAQATDEAIAQTDPLLRQITQMFGAQAASTQANIAAATNAYAHNVGGYAQAIPGMFGEAKSTIGGVSKGVQALLTQTGQQAAGTEAAAMAAAHQAPGAAGPDVPLAKEGKGAGAAAGAIGQAMINALQREQQAAMQYAGQLPGFAQARGGQETNMALAQVASEMAKQLAQTTAEVPRLTYQIYNDLLDRYNADQDRQYSHSQDALARSDALAQRRAGIVAPNAPTNRGRTAYWQDVADRRTKTDPHGYVWEATTTGIRPVKDPKTGRPIVDPAFSAAQAQGLVPKSKTVGGFIYDWDPATQKWVKAAGPGPKPTKPTNTGPYYQNPQTHAWELKPGYRPGPNGTVVKVTGPAAGKQPTNTGPWYKNPKTTKWELKPGYHMEGGKVVKDKPTAKPTGTPTGNRPRRDSNGTWTTADGKPLRPKGQAYWEKRYQQGLTDGRGGLGAANSDSSSGGKPGLIKKKKKPGTP